MLNKKEQRIEDQENFQPIQIAKDAKVRDPCQEIMIQRKKTQSVARQPFADTTERSNGHIKNFLRRLACDSQAPQLSP